MSNFSPLPAYIIGAGCIGLSLNCFFAPKNEFTRFGLPLEASPSTSGLQDKRTIAESGARAATLSMSIKGIREGTYGLAFIASQYQGNDAAVTMFAAIMGLAGLGDGLIVWFHGGERERKTAFGHWFAFTGLVSWAWWRSLQN